MRKFGLIDRSADRSSGQREERFYSACSISNFLPIVMKSCEEAVTIDRSSVIVDRRLAFSPGSFRSQLILPMALITLQELPPYYSAAAYFFSDHSIYVYLSTSLKSLKCSYFSFPPPNERKHLSSLHFTFFSPLSYFFFIPQPQMHPSWGDPNYIPTYLRTYVCTTLLVHKRKLARTTPCGGTRTSPVYLSLPPLLQHFLNNWHFAVNRVLKSKLRCQSAAAAAARTEWQLVMLLASCKLTCKSAYDSLLPYQETDAR